MATPNNVSVAISILLAGGCANESVYTSDTSDAATATDGSTLPVTCTGGDQFVLDGARMLTSTSLAPVTSDDKVVGVNGATPGSELFLFTTRSVFASLDQMGEHDVASTPLTFLKFSSAGCDTAPADCNGFFALAGRYTVLETSPRYRATFELTDLRERTDTSHQMGSVIAGTVSGCIDVVR